MDEVSDELSRTFVDDVIDENVVEETKETPGQKAERELDERKSREALLSEEQRSKIEQECEEYKKEGNSHFGNGRWKEAEDIYTRAIDHSLLSMTKQTGIYYSNRAAARIKQELWGAVIEDCDRAEEFGAPNDKPLERRAYARLHSNDDSMLDAALEDYKKLFEKTPNHKEYQRIIVELQSKIAEKNERMKQEPVVSLFEVGTKVVDENKKAKVYEEDLKDDDKIINDMLPQIQLSSTEISTIKNTGKIGTDKICVFVHLWNTESFVKQLSVVTDRNAKVQILQERIELVFLIKPDYQEIFKGDELIGDWTASIAEAGIQHKDILVVKHADLPWWIEYRECVEHVLKDGEDKKKIARRALEHYKRLKKSGFFDVYCQYENYQRQKHSKVARWTDGDVELICEATRHYFSHLHDIKRGSQDSEFVCEFEDRNPKLGGRSTSTMALVRIHGQDSVTKYYVKCHHYGPKGTSSGLSPDITEFYCYKLLELIGVGAKCHIIPPLKITGTKTSTYIASQWDEKFEMLQNINNENRLSADAVVQLVLIRVLLFISDLHDQNCGVWKGTEDAAIVDFAPTSDFKVYPNIRSEVLTVFPYRGWRNEYDDVRGLLDDDSWLNIAKRYLLKWNIPGKLELARQQLDPTKTLLKDLQIVFKNRKLRSSPTDQLKDYMDTLEKNLENIQTIFEAD